MKKLIATGILLLCTTVGLHAQSVLGRWKTIDDKTGQAKSIVEITENNGKIYGKIIEILTDKKDAICEKCPGADQGKPIKGLTIIRGLRKEGASYSGGTVIDPGTGKEYKCIIKLNGDDKLDVRGYVGIQALGRTQTWVRVKLI